MERRPPVLFRLAGHPLRWRLLSELAESDRRVRELTGELGKPQSLKTYVADRPGHDRRYLLNSGKIRRELGFIPRRTIEDAVRDLCTAFKKGLLPNSFDDETYYNVRTLKALAVS